MALQRLEVTDLPAQLDAIYTADPDEQLALRTAWGLLDLTITREQFEQAIAALRVLDLEFVSASYVGQANSFIDVFNAYAAYVNG